ncbi:hypothetical protein [Priestia megaterium]|uniref:hypothetical protein n=1 Tax=Priestia megaterium TaxID=1404 RepID=UPI001129BB71|nr:hypothetical protein [Priestia megaterium]TPF17933.1 hypothetical protein CBE78_01545 [Priestia megaterium]TPF22041.1 hypothetical protein CBE79_04050 [Priestia megaterium]
MSSLKNIRGEPTFVEGIGNIYPIKIRDWEKFDSSKELISVKKEHFQIEDEKFTNFDVILLSASQNHGVLDKFKEVLKLTLKCELIELQEHNGRCYFLIGNEETGRIDSDNYDVFRSTVMEQNLLIEPKVYKNPTVAAWAEKVMKKRAEGGISVTLEDKITTVATMDGRDFQDYDDYTYYQLEAKFERISKIEESRSQSMMFANPYADFSKMKLVHFAESINLRKDPYKDLFKDSSKQSKLEQGVK